MDVISRFKSLPISTRRLLGIGIIMALVFALPLFVWAIINQKFLINKKAASGEPGVCVAQNNVIVVTPTSDVNGTCHDIQTAVNAVNGPGFTIQIEPGIYNVSSTIDFSGKTNLEFTGNAQAGSAGAEIIFNNASGWGFRGASASGSINWLTIRGETPNGLLSVTDSPNFVVSYTNLYASGSHTVDFQHANNVSIYNSEIQSSAGALEIDNSSYVNIANNRIHNSATGVRVGNSTNVIIMGNLITANNGGAIYIVNVPNTNINHNTIVYNTGSSPTINIYGNNASSSFSQNIVAFNQGAGLVREGNSINFSTISFNDVFGNYTGSNYSNMADPTGTSGNISADPKIDNASGNYCLLSNSPALYGNINNGEYMGYIGTCGSIQPSPTPPTPPIRGECQICGGIANRQCLSGLVCKMNRPPTPDQTGICVKINDPYSCGMFPTPSPSPTLSPSPTPFGIPTPSPTPTGTPTPQTLSLLIKFGGVSDGSAEGAKVIVSFQTQSGVLQTPAIPAEYTDNGIYKLSFTISPPLNSGIKYPLYLKGEKHIKARYCNVNSVLTRCVAPAPAGDGILINANGGSYDLTAYPLEPGDLYPQDGLTDFTDFQKIIALMAKANSALTTQDKLVGDLNYDGYINIKDAFLMRQSLSVRQDDF